MDRQSMNRSLEPFSLSALEQLAKIIGDRYSGSQLTEFFRKAGYPDIRHDGSTKWRFVYSELDKLQSQTSGAHYVAKIVQQLCDPQEFFGNPEGHAACVGEVNEILGFYGLAVDRNDGRIRRAAHDSTLRQRESQARKEFDDRDLHHEVKRHAQSLFVEGRHFHAVFECCKALDKHVSEKSGIGKHGFELMSAALSIKGPLKLNKQTTETERNEQEGLMHLCMGLMSAIRNPESHEPELDWPTSKQDALDMLSLISFLYRRVDATVYFAPETRS